MQVNQESASSLEKVSPCAISPMAKSHSQERRVVATNGKDRLGQHLPCWVLKGCCNGLVEII